MKSKILLVDDDRPILFLMTAVFKRADFDVVAVQTVQEATERLGREKFQLVVSDFFVGEQTGADVVLAVRRFQPELKVIVVTGDVQRLPEWFGVCREVALIVPKPFQLGDLLQAAKNVMATSAEAEVLPTLAVLAQPTHLLPAGIEEMVHRVVDQESIVAITDKKGTIVYANDRFCEISGYSRSELVGQNHRLLKSGHHPPEFYQALWKTILGGIVWRGEICNRAKGGHLYFVETVISPLRSEGLITHFIALRTDITARKEIEAALIEQRRREEDDRRMAALGRMANGFLHDLNNILTGVIGLATETSSVERDELLHDAVGRLVQLTRTMRDYSAGRPTRLEPFLLNPLLRCACSLVRHRKGVSKNLLVIEQMEATHGVGVVGNEGQIFEVVLNLVVNALEASSGSLKPQIVLRSELVGVNVVVRVEDNGSGVPASLAASIFEPFTSTKGEGRGIGLSVSKSIALAHRGDLQLERAGGGGEGAVFQLTLPVHATRRGWPEGAGAVVPAGPERVVLLSEDEVEVRRVITRDASHVGLTVMNAGDTADLLALASRMKEVLAVAIIDSCEVDSEKGAVACLRRMTPELPIILISGRLARQGKTATPWGDVECLPKPFDSEVLIKALRATLK